MTNPGEFRRMVLRLPDSAGDYASVAFTAELAELLGLDLLGLFVEDESLMELAALPGAREFRSLGGGWQYIDAAQLELAARHAAANARRRFGEAARGPRAGMQFDLAKGPVASVFGPQSAADDIIVVIEPKNPAERVTHQFRQLVNVALNAPSAVLLVPSRIRRRAGPIVAVAESAHDPSLAAALRIAASVKERLIVLTPPGIDAALTRLAHDRDVAVERRPVLGHAGDAHELAALLAPATQRFVVLSRRGGDQLSPPRLASELCVPVLITEPDRRKA
jgi:hypothetical protein